MTALAIIAAGLVLPTVEPVSAASAKVTICHRTHSTSNPYRKITVSQSAITRSGGHRGHTAASGLPAVYSSSFSYGSSNKSWGDVIPGADSDGSPYNGANNIQLNWNTAGKAIFFSSACVGMTATQYYDVEVAAGVAPQVVLDELNSMGANEDVALLAALPGGQFTTENLADWDSAVSVETDDATDVTGSGATLNGTVTVGSTSTVTSFEYGTDPTLATSSTVAATPSPVTGSGNAVSATVTGLTGGTTYWFRAVGTTNAGSDTEGVLRGDILSFDTTSTLTQTITFDQPTSMSLGGGTQTLTNATASSGLPVTFTSNSSSICTVSGVVVTAVSAGTCSITATQGGDSTYGAAEPVTRTFAVTAISRTLTIDSSSYAAGGYAGTDPAPTITATPSAGAGTKAYASSTPSVCTVGSSSGAMVFVGVGTCTIGASIAASGIYGAATASTVSFPVTVVARTLTIDSSSYAAGGYVATTSSPPTVTSTPTAGVGTKTYSSSTPSVCTVGSTSGAVTFVAPGTCTIGASIAAAGVYTSATAATVSFPVTAATRTLVIDGSSYASGGYSALDAAPTITSTASAGAGAKSYSSATPSVCTVGASSGVVVFEAAGDCTLGASITASASYGAADAAPVTFEVRPAARTLTIDSSSYAAGGYVATAAAATITSTPSAGVGTKTYSSSTPSVCAVGSSSGTVSFTGIGDCTISATITAAGLYGSATASSVTFPVTRAPRTLTIDASSYVSSGYAATAAAPTLTSTPSAGVGTKTYSSSTPSVCTVDGASGAVTFTGIGDCTIGADIAAAGLYDAATASTITFSVVRAVRTLTIDPSSYEAGGYFLSDDAPTITSTPSAGAESGTTTYTSSTTVVCTIDPATGAVVFVVPGTCTLGAAIGQAGWYEAATAAPVSFEVARRPSATVTPVTTPPPADDAVDVEPDPDPAAPPAVDPASEDGDADVDVTPAADGTITGVVWFDRNRNGVRDGREWNLPGVRVTLERTTKAGTKAAIATTVTRRDGSYDFGGLPHGSYRVSATAEIKGFDRTSDSDGDVDWLVTVGVGTKAPGVADFAGLGKGEVLGQMFEAQTRRGLADAEVTCHWGGFDDVLGTPDDVDFTVTADGEGHFDMSGVPYGVFRCDGVDREGRKSAAVATEVWSPEPVDAPLPVGSPVRGSLPFTGGDVAGVLRLALVSLAMGLPLVIASRRRRRSAITSGRSQARS